MNIQIKNIRLEELNAYMDSEEYKTSSFVPIGKIRALSHQNNPRANKDDYCLFLAYDDDKLIGYLGAITDRLFYSDSNNEKVFWLSCMWVLPEYRRHGTAFELLRHAYTAFKGKVLITNFIPRSKSAFDKTGQYNSLPDLHGMRGYCLLDLTTILVRRSPKLKPLSFLLKGLDALGNLILSVKLKILRGRLDPALEFSEIENWDSNLADFISKQMEESTFRRDSKVFNWMKEYPWIKKVSQISAESKRYYFSQEGLDFKQWFIKGEQNGIPVAFIMLTYFKNELKLPYILADKEQLDEVARFIAKLILEHKVKTFVSYYPELNRAIKKLKLFFHTRDSAYGFLIGKGISNTDPIEVKVHPGDGDGAFT